MKKTGILHRTFVIAVFVLLVITTSGLNVYGALNPANFTDDLNQLIIDGNNLVATMESIALTPLSMAVQVSSLENSVQLYLDAVGNLYKTVAASTDNTVLSLTTEMLVPLQTLSTITVSLAQSMTAVSLEMMLLVPSTTTTVLEASLASMLRLSDDIGVMADRILEMADMILIMADNIGLMADRILATQVIQSNNIKIVVDASLETQKNILLLFGILQ